MSEVSINRLLKIMSDLRDPQSGCPWDLEQTPQSLTRYTIEECYELIDAVEEDDDAHLCEELGDVLLQVVFYTQMMQEAQRFSFDDVVNVLCDKLVRRHPHVFGEEQVNDSEAVIERWEAIKAQEKAANKRATDKHIFSDVPLAFPALMRGKKIQKRAAKLGYDFVDPQACLEQLELEIEELKSAIEANNTQNISDELGDVLFSCVNIARHLKQCPETSLRHANEKFSKRVQKVEQELEQSAQQWRDLNPEQQNALWQKVKHTL